MNGWTHSSCRRPWFTCKAPANSRTPSALISFLLSLQNVRWFVYLHECTKISPSSKIRPNLFFEWNYCKGFLSVHKYIRNTPTNLCCSIATNEKLDSNMWTRLVVLCVYMLRKKWYSTFSNGCHSQLVAASTCGTCTHVQIIFDDSHQPRLALGLFVLFTLFPRLTAEVRGCTYYWQCLTIVTVKLVCTLLSHGWWLQAFQRNKRCPQIVTAFE